MQRFSSPVPVRQRFVSVYLRDRINYYHSCPSSVGVKLPRRYKKRLKRQAVAEEFDRRNGPRLTPRPRRTPTHRIRLQELYAPAWRDQYGTRVVVYYSVLS